MKSKKSFDKLRGGYYTPQAITEFICKWIINKNTKNILEPSCGDGNFLKAIVERQEKLNLNLDITGVELCLDEAKKAMRYRIPVGDMVDMEEVEKDEVPGNPYRVQEDVEVENTVLDDAVEADVITEPKFESVVDDELETEVETFAETAVTGLKTVGKTAVTNAESVVKTDIDVMAESIESGMQNDDIRQIYYRRRLTVEIWSILPGLSCLTR